MCIYIFFVICISWAFSKVTFLSKTKVDISKHLMSSFKTTYIFKLICLHQYIYLNGIEQVTYSECIEEFYIQFKLFLVLKENNLFSKNTWKYFCLVSLTVIHKNLSLVICNKNYYSCAALCTWSIWICWSGVWGTNLQEMDNDTELTTFCFIEDVTFAYSIVRSIFRESVRIPIKKASVKPQVCVSL